MYSLEAFSAFYIQCNCTVAVTLSLPFKCFNRPFWDKFYNTQEYLSVDVHGTTSTRSNWLQVGMVVLIFLVVFLLHSVTLLIHEWNLKAENSRYFLKIKHLFTKTEHCSCHMSIRCLMPFPLYSFSLQLVNSCFIACIVLMYNVQPRKTISVTWTTIGLGA